MKQLLTMSAWLQDERDERERYRCPPIRVIADALRQQFGANHLDQSDDRIRLAIDVSDGRNVLVHLDPEQIRMFGHSNDDPVWDEEHGEWCDNDNADAALYNCVEVVVPFLVHLTGWHVEDSVLVYEPEGDCPRCERSFYDWETSCRDCGDRVDGSIDLRECQSRATGLLNGLIATGIVEPTLPAADIDGLARRLAQEIRRQNGSINPSTVLRILESSDLVAEIYGDEDDIRSVWQQSQPDGDE